MNLNLKPSLTNQSSASPTHWRIPLLIVLFAGAVLITSKSVLIPMQGNEQFTPYAFPGKVPLEGWQLQRNQILRRQPIKGEKPYDDALAGMSYTYVKNNTPLNIEVRYVVATLGDVPSLIRNYAPVEIKQLHKQIDQQYLSAIGYTGRFTHQGRAYLSTCINPHGGSTFSGRQFIQNRSLYDLRPNRWLPLLLGQESLRDRRCLWVHMSVPLNDRSPDQAYQVLEAAWMPWFQWWSPRFPKR